jgi:ferredoxin
VRRPSVLSAHRCQPNHADHSRLRIPLLPLAPPDRTLLDIAAAHQIPAVSACGGNGICSTCRVAVIEGLDQLEPRSEVGDGIRAVFGMETDPRIACRQAIDAGLEMLQRIATLSGVVEQEFHMRLTIGVGKVGPADDLRFGLVGETVTIASRLESQTKELGTPLLVSSAVVESLGGHDGLCVSAARQVAVKGIQDCCVVHAASTEGLAQA